MGKKTALRGAFFTFFFLLSVGMTSVFPMEVEVFDKPPAPPAGGEYMGSKSCEACHSEYYRKWFLSPHASAYRKLKKSSEKADSRCLRCHATGFGVRSGFGDNLELAGVQCEACHGPSSRHVTSVSSPDHTPGPQSGCADCEIRKICMPCHTPKESPNFDFNLYYERIRHK